MVNPRDLHLLCIASHCIASRNIKQRDSDLDVLYVLFIWEGRELLILTLFYFISYVLLSIFYYFFSTICLLLFVYYYLFSIVGILLFVFYYLPVLICFLLVIFIGVFLLFFLTCFLLLFGFNLNFHFRCLATGIYFRNLQRRVSLSSTYPHIQHDPIQ